MFVCLKQKYLSILLIFISSLMKNNRKKLFLNQRRIKIQSLKSEEPHPFSLNPANGSLIQKQSRDFGFQIKGENRNPESQKTGRRRKIFDRKQQRSSIVLNSPEQKYGSIQKSSNSFSPSFNEISEYQAGNCLFHKSNRRGAEVESQISENVRQLQEVPTFKNLSPSLTHDLNCSPLDSSNRFSSNINHSHDNLETLDPNQSKLGCYEYGQLLQRLQRVEMEQQKWESLAHQLNQKVIQYQSKQQPKTNLKFKRKIKSSILEQECSKRLQGLSLENKKLMEQLIKVKDENHPQATKCSEYLDLSSPQKNSFMQYTPTAHNNFMDGDSALSHNSSSILYSPLTAELYNHHEHIDTDHQILSPLSINP